MKAKLKLSFFLFIFFFFNPISSVFFTDTISANQTLSGNQTIISSGGNFVLGFFTPDNSSSSYFGIWYNKNRVPIQTVVWVANRETPISNINSAQLRFSNGNLVILDNSQFPALIWSTNLKNSSNSVIAVLLDDGNLVLRNGFTSSSNLSRYVWESFDDPGDTWLPGAKISFNKRTNKSRPFTSWRNVEDPAPGLFSFELEVNSTIQYYISWNRSERYWTSGAWNGRFFSLIPQLRLNSIFEFSYVENENESYFTYSLYNPSGVSRFVVDVSGLVKMFTWSDNLKDWVLYGSQPRLQCEVYACCGAFGSCDQNSSQFCGCLRGFRRSSERDWNLGDYSGGCVDEVNLQCENNETRNDRFLMNSVLRLPEKPREFTRVRNSSECEASCLRNCSCRAYSYDSDRCSIWDDKILNLQQLNEGDTNGSMIYVKLAASSSVFRSTKNNKGAMIIAAIVVSVTIVLAIILFVILWKVRSKRNKGNQMRENSMFFPDELSEGSAKGTDIPFYNLDTILLATNNFSDENKLGQGGFGPVYKGRFPNGNEFAVKRLSSLSSQGISEFRNEVILIAKLQHRNLVRLLGYCLNQNEKILLYEYMPNKSLDAFLFDQKKSLLLDWNKRFDIILGVARGLIYLHQDSRLRIIHRDLKTSNILLDEEMNPKISDFGLARIVEGKRIEENTNKIVGTYGYMSPEYAMEGKFSVKSDVFSFGVVILEIISGRKNTGFYQPEEVLNLLGYAWRLWCEDDALDLADPTVQQSWDKSQVLKCINVGLLCVQEDPNDRPTMSSVVTMLSSDITTLLPRPMRPAFVMRKRGGGSTTSSTFPTKSDKASENEITVTEAVGR